MMSQFIRDTLVRPRIKGAFFSAMRECRLCAVLWLCSSAPCESKRCDLEFVRRDDGTFHLGPCEELYLTNAAIGDAGAVALAAALKDNAVLRLLDLWNNGIGPTGTHALARALATNSKLDRLYLNENPIGAAGASSLARYSSHTTSYIPTSLHTNL